jgi:hypothetical protein
MAHEFVIDFHGICGFVHDDNWNRVDVVLPKTSGNRVRCDHADVPPHEPRLLIRGEDFAGEIDKIFDRLVVLPDGHWLSCPLNGRTVAMDGIDSDSLVVRRDLRPKDKAGKHSDPCPRYDEKDTSWIAEMELACGKGNIQPDAMLVGTGCEARVELRKGSLECSTLSKSENEVVRFRFEEEPPRRLRGRSANYDQALCESVRYTLIQAAAPVLVLKAGSDIKRIAFRWPSNGAIRVLISHLPVKFQSDPYSHFHCYYDMLQGGTNVPHNVPKEGETCLSQRGNETRNWPKICPVAMFYTGKFQAPISARKKRSRRRLK